MNHETRTSYDALPNRTFNDLNYCYDYFVFLYAKSSIVWKSSHSSSRAILPPNLLAVKHKVPFRTSLMNLFCCQVHWCNLKS